ncbi:hypothetical protein COE51_08355 [Bacillus pseudomycoides]|nr:hypothetical protein COE51_08355 [Bacillus pseudomycoides]
MKKNIKPIQGRQTPNLIGPECIEVTKVYDWVVLTNRDRNKVSIPAGCTADIQNCLHLGGTVNATCGITDTFCEVVDTRPANIGVPSARIVTLGITATVTVTFTCTTGTPPVTTTLCTFSVPVTFIDEVILCVPTDPTLDPLISIECNVFDTNCSVVFNQLLGDFVLLDVVLCKDVQVTRPVKLEVEAKFCGPRQAIPIEEITPQCPPFPAFPEQCPTFFPPENCLCQGSAFIPSTETRTILVADGTGLASVTGNFNTFTTTICDQCTLAESELLVNFRDFPQEDPTGEPAVDQSFTFVATQFNQPTCGTGTPPTTLTVTGVGIFKLAGQAEENASFTLVLNSATRTVTLIIKESSGVDTLVLAQNVSVGVPPSTGTISVAACSRF